MPWPAWRLDEAEAKYREPRRRPAFPIAWNNLGVVEMARGNTPGPHGPTSMRSRTIRATRWPTTTRSHYDKKPEFRQALRVSEGVRARSRLRDVKKNRPSSPTVSAGGDGAVVHRSRRGVGGCRCSRRCPAPPTYRNREACQDTLTVSAETPPSPPSTVRMQGHLGRHRAASQTALGNILRRHAHLEEIATGVEVLQPPAGMPWRGRALRALRRQSAES